MKVLISYHNFVRDFRGSLLLKHVLRALGHEVWLTPHWNRDTELATLQGADVIVGCQVAEQSQAYLAEFARAAGIHLVINLSEQFTSPRRQQTLITYDCDKLNDEVIAFQGIACPQLMDHIQRHPEIRHPEKYKLIGFPRFDLSLDPELRSVETPSFLDRNGIAGTRRRLLYLSSLLFEETFVGVSDRDLDRWGYREIAATNNAIAKDVAATLNGLVRHVLAPDDILLVKKHPWDLSSRLEQMLRHPQVRFLDASEYVVPCMDAADVVLHSYSTAAVEAWAMDKRTIAILPSRFRGALDLVHMSHEVMAEGLEDTVRLLRDYPTDSPRARAEVLLGGLTDGRATVRLALEIDGLGAPAQKRHAKLRARSRLKGLWKEYCRAIGLTHPESPSADAKLVLLAQWERSRGRIARLYAPHFSSYIDRNSEALCHGRIRA